MNVYLGLGSNIGDRRANLARALASLAVAGTEMLRVSPVVESPAMLPDDAPADWNVPFLNIVAECRTQDSPDALLDRLKRIERDMGRVDRGRWAPREIDLDILLFGSETLATDRLRVPHPGITERAFVLAPLAFLDPLLTIPGRGTKTVLEWSRAPGKHLPVWMGIVNVTPDSFSDGGKLRDWPAVEAHAGALHAAGAEILDLGAESTRPNATPLDASDEWARLEPVLGKLVDQHAGHALRPRLSIDTYHPETARRSLALGVDAINDVSGLTSRAMIELAAEHRDRDFIAMHNVGVPADPKRTLPAGADPVAEVERWLEARLEQWQRAGLDLARIVFDPGIGFGKNPLQSLKLLREIARFERYGLRVLVGHSRKSFMHKIAGVASDRDLFTIGVSLQLCARGVEILRVHDVAAHTAAYRGWSHSA